MTSALTVSQAKWAATTGGWVVQLSFWFTSVDVSFLFGIEMALKYMQSLLTMMTVLRLESILRRLMLHSHFL
jgi:hypothetical protein